MLPLLPKRSRRSGNLNSMRWKGLRGVATVATTFININKKKGFRKDFLISSGNSGNSGNKVNVLCIGHRENKKSRCRLASVASVCFSLGLI